ncbi:MAG: hypothetical protein NXI27_25420 [Alphaproteobacteria bacterium]|nr:hypothetical protein [Alphaproteobacteria bacterium]
MFDTEYAFEDVAITVGITEIASCSGTALLEGETGPHDYGFDVTGISLDGNRIGDYCDKRVVRISNRSDDPFCKFLFERLTGSLKADQSASDHYYSALQDHLQDAA